MHYLAELNYKFNSNMFNKSYAIPDGTYSKFPSAYPQQESQLRMNQYLLCNF
ncbi:unnamed protein product [Paramecium octaurelia]|uniref:Uncharacterized protein n=1 Tax=Paramecium octaurelia TaxID=43137 RepID=A0A8S1WYJ7_PAROT|nr:unnamed protein product [Paramecium octaurelia]